METEKKNKKKTRGKKGGKYEQQKTGNLWTSGSGVCLYVIKMEVLHGIGQKLLEILF